MPILYPNATISCPPISRGSTSSIMIPRYLQSHRTAESKPPPTAAGCITATEQSTDSPRPPPDRVWYKWTWFNPGILKRWALLTQLCRFLVFNWTFSPWRIAAGDIFTTVPSPGPKHHPLLTVDEKYYELQLEMSKSEYLDCVVSISPSCHLWIARSSWFNPVLPPLTQLKPLLRSPAHRQLVIQ